MTVIHKFTYSLPIQCCSTLANYWRQTCFSTLTQGDGKANCIGAWETVPTIVVNMLTLFSPVSYSQQTLVTEFGDLGNNRFLDPSSKQSFKFDHLKKEAADVADMDGDDRAEPWRHALEQALVKYRDDFYKHGVSAVS